MLLGVVLCLHREKKALREDKEAHQLGRDFDRKALPRPPNSSVEKENATPPSAEVSATVTASEKEDEPVLSKAQIKRRKKKAATLKTETEESQGSVEGAKPEEQKSTPVPAKTDSGESKSRPAPVREYSPLELLQAVNSNCADDDDLYPDCEQSKIILAEQDRMYDVLMEAMCDNPDNQNLSSTDRVELIKDLAALTYPVVADLIDSVDTLSKPLEAFGRNAQKRVSVLIDPFCIYDGTTSPTTGAIAFVKRKNRVREPLPIKPKKFDPFANFVPPRRPVSPTHILPPSLRMPSEKGEAGPSRLAKLMAEAVNSGIEEDVDDQSLDYAFTSLSSAHFPKRLRELLESEDRDGEMYPLIISTEEYKQVMMNAKKYGISHMDIRHTDTESVVFFPSRLEQSFMGKQAEGRKQEGKKIREKVTSE